MPFRLFGLPWTGSFVSNRAIQIIIVLPFWSQTRSPEINYGRAVSELFSSCFSVQYSFVGLAAEFSLDWSFLDCSRERPLFDLVCWQISFVPVQPCTPVCRRSFVEICLFNLGIISSCVILVEVTSIFSGKELTTSGNLASIWTRKNPKPKGIWPLHAVIKSRAGN